MLKKCLTLVWLTVFSAVLVCCGSSDENIFDAPVHKANAEKTCTMSGISVDLNGDKPNGICGIFVSDSVLLLRGTVKGSPFMVYAYSLNAGSPLGAYIAKGRGPNELLIPQFKEHINESNLLYVFDLSLGSSYSFDYLKSIENHNTVLSELLKLPGRPLYAFPRLQVTMPHNQRLRITPMQFLQQTSQRTLLRDAVRLSERTDLEDVRIIPTFSQS